MRVDVGPVGAWWSKTVAEDGFLIVVDVPPNSQATIVLPQFGEVSSPNCQQVIMSSLMRLGDEAEAAAAASRLAVLHTDLQPNAVTDGTISLLICLAYRPTAQLSRPLRLVEGPALVKPWTPKSSEGHSYLRSAHHARTARTVSVREFIHSQWANRLLWSV